MSTPNSRKHYREVKNYIHNELKLTRDDIKEMMRDVVKEQVKYEMNHGYIEDTLRCMVRSYVVGVLTDNDPWDSRKNPYNKANEEFKKLIREEFENNYTINLSIEKKNG